MDYRLIYEDQSGYCRIIIPDTKFQQPNEGFDSAIGRLYASAIPGVVEFISCKQERIPKDLSFRDAWKKGDVNEPIKIDFQGALQIHRKRLKESCDRKIEQLNQELERALENDNLPQQVAIRKTKKILRTLHEMNLSHCKTIEDIKWAIPVELRDVWTYFELLDPKGSEIPVSQTPQGDSTGFKDSSVPEVLENNDSWLSSLAREDMMREKLKTSAIHPNPKGFGFLASGDKMEGASK